jgi:hypothetical protein
MALILVKESAMTPRRIPDTILLRWTFRRGSDFLTCRLERRSNGAYVLRVIPHSDRRAASLEIFEAGPLAFQRHGYTAARLREMGWMLVDYSRPVTNPTPELEAAA